LSPAVTSSAAPVCVPAPVSATSSQAAAATIRSSWTSRRPIRSQVLVTAGELTQRGAGLIDCRAWLTAGAELRRHSDEVGDGQPAQPRA
jgi:hypothetical protein